jgi:hypothetical protein
VSEIATAIPEAQEGLWLLQAQHEDCRAYNVTGMLRLAGVLNMPAFQAAVVATVRRHDSLRSVFPASGGRPQRFIRTDTDVPLAMRDLSSYNAAEQRLAVGDELDAAVGRRFDLTSGPLFILRLLRLRPRQHVLIMSAHHIVADGWSMDVIYRDLSACYQRVLSGQGPSLPEPPPGYTEYTHQLHQRLESGALEASRRYWSDTLTGLPPEIRLPRSRPRPAVQSFAGDGFEFALDDNLALRVRNIASRAGVTMFTTLLALYGLTIHSLCGQPSFPIGIMAANRDRPEAAGIVGMLANLLPLRLDVDSRVPFADLLRYTCEEILRAREHQEYPFGRIVEGLAGRRAGAPALVQVMFDMEYRHSEPLDLPGITVTPLRVPVRWSKFDLSLIVRDTGDRLEHLIETDSALVDREWAAGFAAAYRDVVEAVTNDPGVPIGRLISIPPPERRPAADGEHSARVAPSGPIRPDGDTEAVVLRLCAALLGESDVSLDDNFLEAGGNSLLAVRLVYEIFRETGAAAPVGQVMRAPTLRDFVAAVADLIPGGSASAAERLP